MYSPSSGCKVCIILRREIIFFTTEALKVQQIGFARERPVMMYEEKKFEKNARKKKQHRVS